MRRRAVILFFMLLIAAIVLLGIGWVARMRPASAPGEPVAAAAIRSIPHLPSATDATGDNAPTNLYAHNLLLRQGPSFRAYIPWMRGQLLRTDPGSVPSFDNPGSFVLSVQKGVLHIYLSDLARLFNSGAIRHAPFSKVSFTTQGEQVHLHATLHKFIPLPFELTGEFSPMPDGDVRLHISEIHVLKLPVGGLLGGLHISIADLLGSKSTGLRAEGNDIILEPKVLLPPPHLVGDLTAIHPISLPLGPGLEVIYGHAGNDLQRELRWHDFLQLTDGTLRFGKLTMRHVDLIMIDAMSKDPWFDLDLSNYQAQLVGGITRTTPQAGLEIFMPGRDSLPKENSGNAVTLEWLKDRNLPPPVAVP